MSVVQRMTQSLLIEAKERQELEVFWIAWLASVGLPVNQKKMSAPRQRYHVVWASMGLLVVYVVIH